MMILNVPSAVANTWLLQIVKTILLVDERENRYARNAQRWRSGTKKYLFSVAVRNGRKSRNLFSCADFEAINNYASQFSLCQNGTIFFLPTSILFIFNLFIFICLLWKLFILVAIILIELQLCWTMSERILLTIDVWNTFSLVEQQHS